MIEFKEMINTVIIIFMTLIFSYWFIYKTLRDISTAVKLQTEELLYNIKKEKYKGE